MREKLDFEYSEIPTYSDYYFNKNFFDLRLRTWDQLSLINEFNINKIK